MTQKHFILDLRHAPLNLSYIKKPRTIISIALATHTRTMAIMLLLRFPDYNNRDDSIVSAPDMSSDVFSRLLSHWTLK